MGCAGDRLPVIFDYSFPGDRLSGPAANCSTLFLNIMRITLYKSSLCPRCRLARKYLCEITANDPAVQVEEVDVLTAPRQSWRAGIRMIPALKIDGQILSALYLDKSQIAEFIARHKY
jgi:hypothetical protein